MPMPSRPKLLFSLFILVLAAIIGGYAMFQRHGPDGAGFGEALVGGPFTLTDHTGRRVTEKDFLGRHALVFFGYTYCPDVCPTELQVMTAALDEMGKAGESIQPVFVTVDPERDTPEIMKSYVENFGPRLIGLTGSPDEIAAMAKAYRVYYAKAGKAGNPDYLMDHSSIIYLMGPDGSYVKHFTYTTDAGKLAQGLADAIAGSP
jgi:cytochrome oxidase Cu insertion factor (SCO1/SenC/PrrC family)